MREIFKGGLMTGQPDQFEVSTWIPGLRMSYVIDIRTARFNAQIFEEHGLASG